MFGFIEDQKITSLPNGVMPSWRLHLDIFWNNYFTTFSKRLDVGLLGNN
jgi:hypothetical protein